MALDICVANNREEAIRKWPDCSIDESAHDKLFNKIDLLINQARKDNSVRHYALINRLRDFYSEYIYNPSELDQLLQEIVEFQKEFESDQQMKLVLENFKQACKKAIGENNHVYAFGD